MQRRHRGSNCCGHHQIASLVVADVKGGQGWDKVQVIGDAALKAIAPSRQRHELLPVLPCSNPLREGGVRSFPPMRCGEGSLNPSCTTRTPEANACWLAAARGESSRCMQGMRTRVEGTAPVRLFEPISSCVSCVHFWTGVAGPESMFLLKLRTRSCVLGPHRFAGMVPVSALNCGRRRGGAEVWCW
jgi:hypothetical protein